MEQREGSGDAWSKYSVLAEKVADLIAQDTPRLEDRESSQAVNRIPRADMIATESPRPADREPFQTEDRILDPVDSLLNLPIYQMMDQSINLTLSDLMMAVKGRGSYRVLHRAMNV